MRGRLEDVSLVCRNLERGWEREGEGGEGASYEPFIGCSS